MREYEKWLAKTSRRDAGNEAVLIWALLGGALSIVLFIFNLFVLYLDVGLMKWIALGFMISGLVALVWYVRNRKIIEVAEFEYNEIMKAKKAAMREKHLEELKQRME